MSHNLGVPIIAPAVEFTGTAQGLAGTAGMGVLAGVVNQEDSQTKAPLQFSEVGQQCGDLGRVVLIDTVESDEGIQDQKDGLELLDGVGQALAIRRGVQSE